MATKTINLLQQFQQIGMLANEIFSDIMTVVNTQQRKIKRVRNRVQRLQIGFDAIECKLIKSSPCVFYDDLNPEKSSNNTSYR